MAHRRSHLPEQAELATIAKEHAAAVEALVAAETEVSDLELAVAKAENDLTPVRERRERDAKRIDEGSVTDPKALTTMVEEVEHLTRRIGTLEEAQLEVMEQHEQAVAVRDRAAALKADLATRGNAAKARRDEVLVEIDDDLQVKKIERKRAAESLPEALLTRYEKIRANRGGIGAVALIHRRCSGCQLEGNAADLRAYATAAPDEVLTCEECGRILVRTEESGL